MESNNKNLNNNQTSISYKPLKDKNIVFALTGSIAVFKAIDFIRKLKGLGAEVFPIMTKGARKFITPLTVSALCGHKIKEFFLEDQDPDISHIKLSKEADIVLVAPASANFIAKAATGICDEILYAVLLATRAPVIIAPAMNSFMFTHPITQANLETLKRLGYTIVESPVGDMACGSKGPGRLASWEIIKEEILKSICEQTLQDKNILITAGPTREPIDPIRFISNRSSGKMGFELARVARRRGAKVHLVVGPVSLEPPYGVKIYKIETASQMLDTVLSLLPKMDIIVMAAAVADFTPSLYNEKKIKKEQNVNKLTIDLVKTPDILLEISKRKKEEQIVVGFCAETEDLKDNAVKKLKNKRLDLIIANDVTKAGSGFDVDTNEVLIIDKNESILHLPLLSKIEVSEKVWDKIESLL